MGEPARGYSWPQFEPGHELSIKHGAKSPRRWKPIAAELLDDLHMVAPWTYRRAYRSAATAWARTEAQLFLVGEWLDEVGLFDDDNNPRPALNLLDKLEARAAKLRHALGLTPMSLASLLRAFAEAPSTGESELDQLRAEGRKALETGERGG